MAQKKHKDTAPDEPSLPAGFWVGGTLSAHQHEGCDGPSDWSHLARRPGRIKGGVVAEKSAGYREKFAEDFALARKFGLNSAQISLSWPRIHTGENRFEEQELEHYAEVLGALAAHGLEPVLVLHEVALPRWFAESGGWVHRDAAAHFTDYAERVAEAFGGKCRHWIPIFEPEHWLHMTAKGEWPGGVRSPLAQKRMRSNLADAWRGTAKVLRSANPDAQIGLSVRGVQCAPRDERSVWDLRAARRVEHTFNRRPLEVHSGEYDFLAFSLGHVYETCFSATRYLTQFADIRPRFDVLRNEADADAGVALLRYLLDEYKTEKRPVLLAGCGFPTDEDTLRCRFVAGCIDAVLQAREAGMDVRGFWHRALLDGFAWREGYTRREGLVHVDFSGQARTPNPSAFLLGEIAERGALSPSMRARYGLTRKKAKPKR